MIQAAVGARGYRSSSVNALKAWPLHCLPAVVGIRCSQIHLLVSELYGNHWWMRLRRDSVRIENQAIRIG